VIILDSWTRGGKGVPTSEARIRRAGLEERNSTSSQTSKPARRQESAARLEKIRLRGGAGARDTIHNAGKTLHTSKSQHMRIRETTLNKKKGKKPEEKA